MPILFTNNASAPLASSISSSATTIVVTTGQGALFPALSGSNYFYATLTNSSNQLEIVKVTARSSDTMTVVRGQEGTTARAYSAADKIEVRVTAAGLNAMVQFDGASAASGSVAYSTGASQSYTSAGTSGQVLSSAGASSPVWIAQSAIAAGSATLATTATLATSAVKVTTTNFTIEESGGKLVFKYGTTAIASLDSSGNFIVLANSTAYGTP